ncbi:expressed protein [Cryptococcus deneoformans JEC21]|uniref:Expressed protein n=1 Tax=Cryptococcus deneoformans (strain JEC21 / ATCC MYA-565) TaxID=214684 RepID=Q5KKQ2_CRYD1|nr:expressed protein [Cryptococcus neoformans var. neoformans JEC21]AAW42667.2 expressed protein [Cryptococcus neoformans var. neoformans JEC21]
MSQLLWISDASPLFFYSPAEAYFAGQGLNSWVGSAGLNSTTTVAAANGGGGTTTYHSTTGMAGVIIPAIYATSFVPIFSAPDSYDVTMQQNSNDPQDWKSGQNWTSSGGDFSAQTFTIEVSCQGDCDDDFIFEGAWVETELAPEGSDTESVSLDDSSLLIQYTGFTSVEANSQPVQVSSSDYNSSLSMTSTAGATAQVMFTGASVMVSGVSCPFCSTFSVSLDSKTAATLDSANNATVHGTLLYFATNLDTSDTHTLILEAEGGGTLVIDEFTVNGPKGRVGFIGTVDGLTTTVGPSSTGVISSDGSSSNTASNSGATALSAATEGGAPNVGVIIGAILGSLAGVAILYFLCRKAVPAAKSSEKKKMDPWDEANLLQNMKNEGVHVTTVANQRYVYPGLIAHSDLTKK